MDEKAEQLKESAKTSWEKLWDKIESWGEAIILNLPNFILAILVFILFLVVARFIKKWMHKILERPIRQISIRNLIANVTSTVVVGVGFVLALNILNLNDMLTSILAGAGVAGLAVGLALQGTLSNTFSGIFLALRNVISVGDWVETNGYAGTILDIDLRNTQLKEADNNIVVLPNKMILENPFKNFALTKRVRSTVKCGVGYESDLEQVKKICVEAIQAIFPPNEGEEIEFHYLEFGDSSINFQVRFWGNAQKEIVAVEAKSQAIIAIKKAFDANNINIPFPIRTLQYDMPLRIHSVSDGASEEAAKEEEEQGKQTPSEE